VPPIVLRSDMSVVDGFHRLEAAWLEGCADIEALMGSVIGAKIPGPTPQLIVAVTTITIIPLTDLMDPDGWQGSSTLG